MSSSSSSSSSVNNQLSLRQVSHLGVTEGNITAGQGEYIVFFPSKGEVKRETFEKVWEIFNSNSPAEIIKNNPSSIMDKCLARYEKIKSEVKKIDSTLEIAFVPRTLYELIYLRQSIEEELQQKKSCPLLMYSDFFSQKYCSFEMQSFLKKTITEGKCWHLCRFEDTGNFKNTELRQIAYRLNQIMVKELFPNAAGFTYGQLTKFAEAEITFLREHYKKGLAETLSMKITCNTPGPTANFGVDWYRGSVTPMPIADDEDVQIVKNAVTIDCSNNAEKAFFLYRGACFSADSVQGGGGNPRSLSYGTGLFAGVVRDAGATAFKYMRIHDPFAIEVAFDQLKDSPFYIPSTHTLEQLLGVGEIFHARTKVWKDADINLIGSGIYGGIGIESDNLSRLESDIPKDKFIKLFEIYKKNAISLKC